MDLYISTIQQTHSSLARGIGRRSCWDGKRHTIGPAAGGFVLLGETGEAADTCGSTVESRARG